MRKYSSGTARSKRIWSHPFLKPSQTESSAKQTESAKSILQGICLVPIPCSYAKTYDGYGVYICLKGKPQDHDFILFPEVFRDNRWRILF